MGGMGVGLWHTQQLLVSASQQGGAESRRSVRGSARDGSCRVFADAVPQPAASPGLSSNLCKLLCASPCQRAGPQQ